MKQAVTLRAASPDDVAAIADVCARAARLAYAGLVTPDYIERAIVHWFVADRLRREIAATDSWFGYAVATIDDRVVGVAGTGRIASGDAELYTLYVDPLRQRTGVGAALVAHEVERAVSAGASRLDVAVLPGNVAAMRFYEACGFAWVGERPIYAPHGQHGGPHTAVVYRLRL